MKHLDDLTIKRLLFITLIIAINASLLLVLNYLGFFSLIKKILVALIPAVMAVFVAFLLEPMILFFIKHNIKRSISVLLTYFIFALFLALLGWLLIPNIIGQVTKLITNLPSLIASVSSFFSDISENYGINIDFALILNGFIAQYSTNTFNIIISIFNNLINVTLVVGGSLFLSFDFDRFKNWIKKYIPKTFKNGVVSFFREYLTMIHRYVFGILLDAVVLWILSTTAFWIIGLDYPLVFGLIVAIFDLVPIIGPYLGGTPAVLVGLTSSVELALLVVFVLIIIQTIDGNFIQPYIVKNVIYVHPLESIISLSIMGTLFGLPGMIASPLVTIAIKIITTQISESKREKEKEIIEMRQVD
jgi:predicted PurR-regulated permease PerM